MADNSLATIDIVIIVVQFLAVFSFGLWVSFRTFWAINTTQSERLKIHPKD